MSLESPASSRNEEFSQLIVTEERVWASDGKGQHYPAVVREIRGDEYLIHYVGWNDKYDEWVEAEQLSKEKPPDPETKSPVASKTKVSDPHTKKRKRSNANAIHTACKLPFTLNTVLLDEWEKINRISVPDECQPAVARQEHVLPAPVTIRQVLDLFVKRQAKAVKESLKEKTGPDVVTPEGTSTSENSKEKDLKNSKPEVSVSLENLREFRSGLVDIFQEALFKILLYESERALFEEYLAKNQDAKWVDICGCEYLLRLYVRLPALIDDDERPWVASLLSQLLVLLQKNCSAIFKVGTSNYRNVIHSH